MYFKIYDLNGIKIKNISEFKEKPAFLDTYYVQKRKISFIFTVNREFIIEFY